MEKELRNKIKYLISKGKTGRDICDAYGLDMTDLFACVKELNEDGFPCYMDGEDPVKVKGTSYTPLVNPIPNEVEYCFISDLHLGSTYDRVDILRRIYEECRRRGVTKIFCSGDITDGEYPKRPHYADHQAVMGFDNVVNYVCKSIPYYQDITMYAISGNHDDSFTEGAGESILNRISSIRKDFIYLGKNQAVLTLDNTVIKLMHGYRKKKDMDERIKGIYYSLPEDEEKPDILALGHIHTSAVRKIDDTVILQCGALMDDAEFIEKKLYTSEKSCFFVKVYHDDYGNIIDMDIDYMTFEDGLSRKRVKDYKL